MDLRGAVVVVTGASSGIGRAAARIFAAQGGAVVLAARRLDRLEEDAERIRRRGGTAVPVRCDVSDLDDLETLRAAVAGEFGRCDVLVNNAGIPGGGPFLDLAVEQIERVNRVNYLGVVLATKLFLPMMLERRRGHVVNVASLAGRFATPNASQYTASKHAVVAFSESLYYELKPYGILVTVVNPWFTETEGFPQGRLPRLVVMPAERVAREIVDVVRRGKAPELSLPRAASAVQALRVLTPPLYRWGVETVTRRFAGRAGTPALRPDADEER